MTRTVAGRAAELIFGHVFAVFVAGRAAKLNFGHGLAIFAAEG